MIVKYCKGYPVGVKGGKINMSKATTFFFFFQYICEPALSHSTPVCWPICWYKHTAIMGYLSKKKQNFNMISFPVYLMAYLCQYKRGSVPETGTKVQGHWAGWAVHVAALLAYGI